MYTDMEMWAEIRRRVLVEGQSKRSVIRHFGIHWDTLAKMLLHAEPPGYRRKAVRGQPVLGPYLGVVEEILLQDRSAPPKQRHTAKRIFDRLRAEYGYPGSYTRVKDAVRAWRRKHSEAFVPLIHRPGEAQVDFGHATVEVAGESVEAALFVLTLPHSDAFFVCAFPRECTEAFMEGHRRAFQFIEGVPWRISYDNSKIAVAQIVGGRGREVTREFGRLKSHYLFEAHFCRVRRPHEKGHVENLVGYGRRNFLVPVPKVGSFEELNRSLEDRCQEDLIRKVRGKEGTKAERLAVDRAALLALPKQDFEARRLVATQANSLSLVRFDRNDYSVPTDYAHHRVLAVGSIDEVRLVVADRVVARHRRHWGAEGLFFQPEHYLALLERKPGALDFARPLEQWQLPDGFGVLRRRLEADLGGRGTREFIKVLRLLERSSLGELHGAVDVALGMGATSSDAVRLILEHRREKPVGLFCLDGHPHLKSVRVDLPDLTAYGSLSVGGIGRG